MPIGLICDPGVDESLEYLWNETMIGY